MVNFPRKSVLPLAISREPKRQQGKQTLIDRREGAPIITSMDTGKATMESANWKEADSLKAKQIWIAYQQQHDLSAQVGQTVGIDPASGRIWFGESIQDVVAQREAEGLDSPLFFERVGSATYFRKGAHW
jgi:hypothetical protein